MFRIVRFLVFSCYFIHVCGYNVDVNFPIIHEDPSHERTFGRNSYFGYSVLLNNSWIQIGAPRANASMYKISRKEPGVAYRCRIKGKCTEISIGRARSPVSNYNIESLDYSWFGVAMDFERTSFGRVVVCGHRWSYTDKYTGKYTVMPGACYWFKTDDDLQNVTNIILPTDSKTDRYLYDENNVPKAYKAALSQGGAAVHIIPKNMRKPGLLFGAPGYLNWKGSVVKCNNMKACHENFKILDVHRNPEITDFDLLGYHISSGCFRDPNECLPIAGAPRDETMRGYVMVFDFPKKSGDKWSSKLKIQGHQTGEYFGSSFAVADFTGDGRDDLAVGAPFHSVHGDEGCIYIYTGDEKFTLIHTSTIRGEKLKGRFGTAVASLGDLDKDGYADIVVGAPYEENGAIYIYYGSSHGLVTNGKRITALEIDTKLKGFGISFAGLADIDGNGYNDIAVGAYLSGHAVIFRTRPVVDLATSLKPAQKQLRPQDDKLTVEACLWYTGKHVPSTISVTRKISADETLGRVTRGYREEIKNLHMGVKDCESITFSISRHTDNLSPLQITLTQELIKDDVKKSVIYKESDEDEFEKQGPVERLLKNNTFESYEEITFKHCEAKDCVANLKLDCYLKRNGMKFNSIDPYVIGSPEKLQLLVETRNEGDPAYSSAIEVGLPEAIGPASIPSSCSEKKHIFCNIGTLRRNANHNLTLDLDLTDNPQFADNSEGSQEVQINVTVSSIVGQVKNSTNNCNVPLILSVDADAALYGKSQEDNYYFSKSDTSESDIGESGIGDSGIGESDIGKSDTVEVVHLYEFYKTQISPIKEFEIELRFPEEITTSEGVVKLLSKHRLPTLLVDNNFQVQCTSDVLSTDSERINEEEVNTPETGRMKRSLDMGTVKQNAFVPLPNRTLYINCSNEKVTCRSVKCRHSSNLLHSGRVTLELKINVTNVYPLMGQKDILQMTSEGYIKILNPKIVNKKLRKGPHSATASSPIIRDIPQKVTPLWIPVLAAVGGIFLLMLIIMGLSKAGFFKREKKLELEALKRRTVLQNLESEAHFE